jgi:uncharacterized protein (TIGR00255 family)
MLSMTGFGSGKAGVANVGITVELRSVNHRFMDAQIKLPPALASFETAVLARLRERLSRGRIACAVQMESGPDSPPVAIDAGKLTQAVHVLKEAAACLERETGRTTEISLDHLLAVPELFRGQESALAEDVVRAALLEALDQAIDALLAMKQKEGRELAEDLKGRLARLRALLDGVKELAPRAAPEAFARLQARLKQLAADEVDPQRLAQEAALLADRVSINEECERLSSHLEQFAQVLQEAGPVAKRLNFLLQEIHREVNTMGSKTNLLEITHLVIDMKDEVESMREQIQNLE